MGLKCRKSQLESLLGAEKAAPAAHPEILDNRPIKDSAATPQKAYSKRKLKRMMIWMVYRQQISAALRMKERVINIFRHKQPTPY